MDNQKYRRAIDTIARNCIALRLRLLNRVVTNLYDDALRSLGLKVSQLIILVVTAKLGRPDPRRSATFSSWTRRPSAATSKRCGPRIGWKSSPARTPGRSRSA